MNVSVVIPVKNEEKSIEEVLRSLLSQTRPPDEIVITDGGSSDRTVEIINRFIEQGANIRLFREKEALPGKGRNVAIAGAKSDLIALTDAGTVLAKNWLESLLEPLKENPDLQVVYGVQGICAKTLFEKCFVVVYRPPGKPFKGKTLYYPYMGSLLIKKEVWEKAGPIREDLRAAEDLLFFRAIQRGKFKSTVKPEAVAYWRPRSNFKEAFNMGYKYSECDALTGLHGDRFAKKLLRYAIGILLLAMGFYNPVFFWLLGAGFIINNAAICRKNWADFVDAAGMSPLAYVLVIGIMVTLDVSSIAGYVNGVRERWMNTDKRWMNTDKEG
jgi:glycosyltransferase involved in cell wall biosynthesis